MKAGEFHDLLGNVVTHFDEDLDFGALQLSKDVAEQRGIVLFLQSGGAVGLRLGESNANLGI